LEKMLAGWPLLTGGGEGVGFVSGVWAEGNGENGFAKGLRDGAGGLAELLGELADGNKDPKGFGEAEGLGSSGFGENEAPEPGPGRLLGAGCDEAPKDGDTAPVILLVLLDCEIGVEISLSSSLTNKDSSLS
jgi:hypothetical protein